MMRPQFLTTREIIEALRELHDKGHPQEGCGCRDSFYGSRAETCTACLLDELAARADKLDAVRTQ